MAKFVFVYHGGSSPDSVSPEGMAEVMAAWEAWYGELGEAIVDGGNPFGQTRVVTADAVATTNDSPATGYTVIDAADIDAAVAAAKGCPILAAGGNVEVAEALDM